MGRESHHARSEIGNLLWEWDIIGLRRPRQAEDEYDCLIGSLYERLQRGDDRQSIKRYLSTHIPEHFGFPCPPSVGVFVEKLKRWWDSGEESGDTGIESPLVDFEMAEDRWWLYGDVDSDRLPDIAVNGLLGGLDSPSLVLLAGANARDVRDNRDLWELSLRELGREPPPADPLARMAWRLLDAICARRIEACRGAHRLYWLAFGLPEQSATNAPERSWLFEELVSFIQEADDCEGRTLDDRDGIRAEIIDRAADLRSRVEARYFGAA